MKLKKKVKKYPNGGKAPIKGTKEQYQAYQDSLDLYNYYKRVEDLAKANKQQEFRNEVKLTDKKALEASIRLSALNNNRPPSLDMQGESVKFGNTTMTYLKAKKPVQPIIYQPEEKKVLYSKNIGKDNPPDTYVKKHPPIYVTDPNDPSIGMYTEGGNQILYKPKERPKEQPINIQSAKPDLLQGSDINMFNPIPFEKGTYFTRPKQGQEIGDRLEYFDKKTGHKLMQNGGNMNMYRDDGFNSLPQVFADGGINSYDVPAQMPTNSSFFQLPYNELANALMTKQKAYDTQEAEIAKNQAFLTDLKSGYRTSGLPQEIQKEYNSKFQNYIGQDLTDPNIKRSLVQDIANLKGDPRLRTLAADIKQSALWDAYQQAHPAEAGAAVNPYKQGEQWTPAKDEQGNWLSEDQVNNWYGNITPYTDFNKPIDEAYSKVKANVVQTLTDSGIKVQHDEATGKDFFYKDITKKDRQYIDESLPQWQAAATEQAINFQSSSTPEARYFQARFANEIAQDPDFIKKYISTAGGKYVYKQEKTEDISKQVGSSSGSGSGSGGKEVKTASPFQITQITKTNPNLQGYKLPQETIKEIDSSISQYIQNAEKNGFKTHTNEKGQIEFAIPANATIDQINEIQAKNAELSEIQRQKQNLIDINNIVASKHGFKPNAKGEYDIISQLPLNLQKEVKEAYNTAVRQRDYYNNQTQGSSMTGASIISTPPPNPDAVVKNIASKDPRFKKYLEELETISKGIKLTGGNAYPLVGEEFKDVNAGIMNLLTQKTNYFDGDKGDIQYLQNNDKISNSDKEYVSKLIAEKGLSELNGRTSIFWDVEKGEYSALTIFPRSKSEGGDLYLKIGQNLLGGLPTESMKLDPIYNESSKQLFRKGYEDHSQATNNIHGRIGGVTKDFETTHVMANDLDNKGNKLNVGETVFTLPELPNIIIKVGTFEGMDDFMRVYEQNKPQGTALLELLKNNKMTPITSPGFYNRYKSRELKPSFAPKQ